MTNLVAFSHNQDLLELLDGKLHTHHTILQQTNDWWGGCQNHIQWLFPSFKSSRYNINAPLISKEEAEQFNKNNYDLAVWRFYDYLRDTNGLAEPNHNDLRLTRMLECYTILYKKPPIKLYNWFWNLIPSTRFCDDSVGFWARTVTEWDKNVLH